MRFCKQTIFLLLVGGFLPAVVLAAENGGDSKSGYSIMHLAIEDEYDLVKVPAGLGKDVVGGAFLAPGIPLAFVFGTLYFPFSGESRYYKLLWKSYHNYSDVVKTKLSYLGYYSIGIPFYIAKKTGIDLPIFLYESTCGASKYSEKHPATVEIAPPEGKPDKIEPAEVKKDEKETAEVKKSLATSEGYEQTEPVINPEPDPMRYPHLGP